MNESRRGLNAGENNGFYGKRHTEETRRKMSEAHRGRGTVCRNPEEGYKLLITAVICRALKDNAISFFDTDTGKYYCDVIGIDTAKLLKKTHCA